MPATVDPDGVEPATIRELVDLNGLRVLDVGCGDGRLSVVCAREGANVLGFDPDEDAVATARAETPRELLRRLRFEVAHAREIELPKGEFDLALFSWSLWWVETEDVVHVLRHVEQAVRPGGNVLDIHPLGIDMAVRAGSRGLGFVDASAFALVVGAMNEAVDQIVSEGLLEEVRVLRRAVVERFDDSAEALEEADGWTNLRLPTAVRRRLREADERPVEFVDTVRYRLFRTAS